MKKTIITRLSAALWLQIIVMAIPLKASAIEESQVIPLKAIKSTGEQSLNTGYTHKANTRIVLDCEVTKNTQRNWEALFGARLGDYGKNAFCFFSRHWNHTNSATDGACYNRSGEETNGSNFVYGERIKLVAEGKTATWYRYSNLNTAFGSVTTGGTADDGKTPMFLFDLNTSGSVGGTQDDKSKSVMTLYSCKIYEGSTLMCDFVPAKYDNTVGLYDRVNKTFHRSRTDKPFTAIEKTSSDATFMYLDESQVTLLDAIKSTGEQAFNTGYTHKANTRMELDCNVTKNSQREWEALFGARLKNFSSNAFCFFSRHHKNSSVTNGPCFNRSGVETVGSNFVYDERIKLVAEGKTATWYKNSNLNIVAGSVTTTGTADDGKTPMFLFNLNTSDAVGGTKEDSSPSVMTLYGCKIYEGSTLKCDFVPAKYNDVVGLYDRVNKTFSGSRTTKPFEAVTSETNIAIDATNFPDEAFRNYLLSQSYGEDGVITSEEMKNITTLSLTYSSNGNSSSLQEKIQSLQGIEFFTALESLICDNNQLTTLDLSSNTALKELHCDANQLTTLTLPESTVLEYLFCAGNKLTTLDLSKNPNLYILHFFSNQIKDAGMDALVASLPTREGFLRGFFEVIDATDKNEGNKMTTAQVEAAKQKGWRPTYLPKGSNEWQEYAGSDATPEGTAIDATNFPDETFRNYLLGQSYGKDGVITPEEIQNITNINVKTSLIWVKKDDNKGDGKSRSLQESRHQSKQKRMLASDQQPIQSLQGIEFFTALESLICDGNQLTTLDLSKNTALEFLSCYNNQLTALKLPETTTFKNLYCYNNKLATLDVSKNTALETLYCDENQLTTLDLSNNSNLLTFSCCSNQIKDANMDALVTSLPTRQDADDAIFYVVDATDENEGNVMTATQVEAAKQKGWKVYYWQSDDDEWQDYPGSDAAPEGIAIDATNFPDETFRNYLLSQEYGKDGVITPEEIQNITNIDVAVTANNQQPIQSLQGIEFFTALKNLTCDGNQLTTLDLSKNTALESLSCAKNQLTALDLSKNTALETLFCNNNQLTTLDLSNNSNLLDFSCFSNQIKDAGMDALVASLPTREGFPKGIFEVIDATDENEGNVMTTTQVEAVKQKGWKVYYLPKGSNDWQEYAGSDATPEGLAIDATNFPDETFRNYLLSQDYGLDGVITPQEIQNITYINVQMPHKAVKTDDDDDDGESRSLQESRYQSKQKRMLASDQQPIQSLQGIEFFTALKNLTCDGNQLTTLDLSKNTALEALSCPENRLTTLKLPENTTLKTLYCYNNKLATLDVSKNTVLNYLSCYNNQLTTLDVSKNTALTFLYCNGNQLTTLDVSKNTALKYLYCEDNQLSTLDLSKNTQLCGISFYSNQIKDAGMDALVASLPTKQNNEKAELYVFDATNYQGKEGNVMTTTQVEAAKQKGWKVYYWRSDDDDRWQEYAGSTPIVTYPVWVGETQITENNMNDVLGDGKVTYTPGNNTGTLKFKSNTTINGSHASAKIYVDGIDLVINAPKGIVLENSTLGISMGGENRKLTVNGDITIKVLSPAINNCQELTINGNLTVESSTPIYCKSITVNGNVKVTGSTIGLNAPTIVLNGTKHEFNTSYPCISSTNGAVTITGDLTATANDRPTIVASGSCVVTLVSGTWTLDGGNCYAIELGADDQLVIPSTHAIVEPENAQMKTFTGRNPYTTIADADGNAATHVVIAPHHVHSMKETTGKGATCTEPGFETYWTCTSCNKMFSDEQGENEISAPREIPATGHIWGEWVVTREATTTQEGEETRTCLNDPSHKETRPIPVLESGIAIDETNFPDANFRQFVLDNYDKKSNKLLSDEEIAAVTCMDIDEKEIADLTGIEYFTALKDLSCYNNKLKALDLSKNTALQSLVCQNNQLKALDLSKNTALQSLACQNNQLKALDLSKNTELHLLGCGDNQLTALDLSKNTKLITLDCYLNQINGKAMDALIESLPQVTDGEFYAISTVNDKEQNVITKSQVAAAKAKGWTVYDRTEKPGFTYEEYEGSSDPVPDGIRNAMNGNGDDDKLYNLQGRRVERVAKKGVFIKNGKKVIRK